MIHAPESDRSRRLCAVLGHELRNPLASALTGVAVALAMLDKNDPRAEHLRRATADLERLAALLRTYLEFGRSGAVTARPIDIGDVVRAVASRNACTSVRASDDPIPVYGDPELLGRALDNLVENALEAGATAVTMTLTCREGAAVIEVADDGPGVPAALRETLFDPFVSGHGSSGLGLAVARDAIENQGGQIMLLDARRRGACFRIILPVDEARVEAFALPAF